MSARIRATVAIIVLTTALWLGLAPLTDAALTDVVINEVLVGNASTYLEPTYFNYSAWIELYNSGSASVNVGGMRLVSLREGRTTPDSYTLPSNTTIAAGAYLLIWYDEENSGLHTPFELDMDGGLIELRTAAGDLIDALALDTQQPDVSHGRAPGGGWAYFDQPTPGAANTTPAHAGFDFADAPDFSVDGGRYGGAQSVALSTTEPGGVVRYTLDGSRPTAASPVYSAPLNISAITVVRARTFAAGKMTSPTVSNSYLINAPASLPIVSLATNPAHVFDNTIGIYVEGNNGIINCGKKANWNRSWERPASIEVYETNGSLMVGQDIGFEIHGNCTRNLKQKSFELKARKVYGDNDFSYAFFSDKPLTSYRRLLLRAGGQDTKSLLRDVLGQQLLVGRMDIDRQAYRPALVYINGQFWGIYGLREKMDEDYIENTYGLDEETDFDVLDDNRTPMAGNATRWNEFYNYLSSHNPADPAVYAYLQTQMDLNEFINYQIAEIYAANTDWPQNNIRFWRTYAPNSRWRWMIFDMDYAFGLNTNGAGHNTLRQAMSNKSPYAYHALILRKLWTNTEFRALFAQRFAAHLNTTYTTARVTNHINSLSGAIAPMIPAQAQRWQAPKTAAAWQKELTKLRNFANKRPATLRTHLKAELGGNGSADLTIQVTGAGQVSIAGLPVDGGYSGPHFVGLPITLEALPADGQDFSHWQETGGTNPIITVTLSGAMTRTAVFGDEPPPPPLPDIVINEIHYRPLPESTDEPNKEFVELYNAGATAADLSGYTISAISFTFPANSVVDPGEFVVVAANSADPLFGALDADDLFDWAWGSPDNQKLSNGGEAVILRHSDGRTVDSVTYTDDPPWPIAPDQEDKTLSLLAVTLDNSLAASWAGSRQIDGTPGAENFPPLPPTPPLVINEIHYNPADSQGPDAAYEFIEVVNTGDAAVDLEGYTLVGVEFIFPAGATIEPGEFIVLAADSASYTGSYDVYQWTSGDLDDAGERVALIDPFAQVADEVTYDDEAPWPTPPNGSGPTLSLGRPALDNSLPASWAASRQTAGTPGAENFPRLPLVINELHHTPSAAQGADGDYEFLELTNTGATPIDLTGYTFIGVDGTLPAASIDPGEFIVVADNPLTYAGGGYQVFNFDGGLSNGGERVAVYDPFGNLVDEVTYGVADPWPGTPNAGGPSLSLREPALDNTVAANWDASRDQGGTPGAENFPPLPPTPPLVINEIHYNPAAAQGADGDYEFIEIVNTGPAAIDLEGVALSGVNFTFPAGATIAAGEHIVLAANAASYSGSYQTFQWSAGELADDGETLTLTDALSQVVDEVTYDDEALWPAAPNGSGPSLSLGDPALDNSLAANWAASDFAGGTPGAANWPALPLVIGEVHYSVNAALQPGGDNEWEFFELTNAGDRAFDLGGYTTSGVTATFATGTTIAAGETIVVANNAASYAAAGCDVYEWSSGGLSSSGETLTFRNRFGVAVLTFAYGTAAPWPTAPNGGGPTLALLEASLDNSDPANWDASRETGGTPCAENFPPLPPTPPLVINEIHYNPAVAQGPDAAFEFIEIVNSGPDAVNLEGVTFAGVTFTFPAGATIAAGEHIVLAADAANYNGSYQTFQWSGGELADDGETLTLADALGQPVDEVTYGDGGDWPAAPDGDGPTLSLGKPDSDNTLPASWAASDFAGGTPGAANWPELPLVVSELHYKVNETLQPGGDEAWEFFEVYNAGNRAFDLGGYTISGFGLVFPGGTTIAAGETIVVANEATTYAAAGCAVYDWVSGGLSSSSETLIFRNRFNVAVLDFTYATAGGWPTAPNGGGPTLALLDLGYDNALPASWDASRETGGTPCAENFPPLPPTPPLVINEIHYNPADTQGNDAAFEFIEIVNNGAAAVDLEGYTLAGVAYTFLAGATIDPGEIIVLAADSASYSGGYDVYQWMSSDLDDSGERVAILDPYARVIDEVTYDDEAPWPTLPAGGGRSLSLLVVNSDNAAPESWAASDQDGGTPGAANWP